MQLQDLNLAVILPIVVIQLILMIIALVDLVRRESTRGPKLLWVFVIFIGNILGSIVYFTVGRKSEA
ncbi:PLD nuclease N-terminal domain-containing protein [Candidatus Pristimantibacillus sp. PTI5]|uniref:PLD nuclease N-terminal domain-containing protein n=1 Tax=Candidatus Pristimantibacillus sp. PTI5 TaxID=3400422 RepID=UPI003B01FB9B